MNVPPDEFYRYSWREFFLKLHGFTKSEYKEWERVRLVAYVVASASPNRGKKQMPSITRWLPLPTDKKHDLDTDKMKIVWDKIRNRDNGTDA